MRHANNTVGMESEVFCEETDIDWEAVLQQMPDSPGICLDDFVVQDDATNFLLPSLDRDVYSNDGLQSASESLSALTDLLFNDEDFKNSPARDGGGGFIDIKSFLADACGLPQQDVYVDKSDDANVTTGEGQIQRGDDVEACADVDIGENGGQILQRNKEEADGEVDAFTRKRKRNRESAVKSRERRKAYEKSLEAKCRMLERQCGRLQQSLNFSLLENAALKNELFRVRKPYPHCHGGGAEPAALLKDSLQKESLLCGVMVWVMVVVLFLLPPKAADVVVVVVILGERERSADHTLRMMVELGFGVKRRWKWSRKKMK